MDISERKKKRYAMSVVNQIKLKRSNAKVHVFLITQSISFINYEYFNLARIKHIHESMHA